MVALFTGFKGRSTTFSGWHYIALTYSFRDLDIDCRSISHYNSCFLTLIQISQKAGKLAWYPHLLKNFPQFAEMYTVKGIDKINTAEVDGFLEFPCFFYDLAHVGNLMSHSSGCSKSSLNFEFSVHVLLQPFLENFELYFAGVWDEFSCAVVWIFFGIVFSGIGLKTDHRTGEDQFSLGYWVQFSRSIISDSLGPHGSQHAKPPYPSPVPRVHTESIPLTSTSDKSIVSTSQRVQPLSCVHALGI